MSDDRTSVAAEGGILRTDLADQFTAVERVRVTANLRPVDAATLALIDRSGRKPRILLGKRRDDLKFLPGKFVFPGGRVDPADRKMPVFGMLETQCERRLLARVVRPSLSRARAQALAAIRETYEETGLLVGTTDAGPPPAVGDYWDAFTQAGVYPNLEALTFVARAITPPRRPRRFDTRFFVADVRDVAARVEGMVGPNSELVELKWLTFEQAKAEDVPVITRTVIEDIEARMTQGFRPYLPVPFYYMRGSAFHRELID